MTSSTTDGSSPIPHRSATPVATPSVRSVALSDVPDECRAWLAPIADLLIPSDGRMPAASDAGAAGRQLDLILRARPDLYPHLLRAWVMTQDLAAHDALEEIQDLDAEAYDAVRVLVAGGYYANPEIRELLGYTGQQPRVVRVDNIPEYVEEGLLERVMERGPIYREA